MRKIIFPAIASVLIFAGCSKKEDTVTANPVTTTANQNNGAVGVSAKDFLTSSTYNTIHVQVQYMPGYAPDAASLTNLTNFLNSLVFKPGGIIMLNPVQIAASGKSVLTVTDINAVETANRTLYNAGSVLTVYVLYADAPFSTANVLGAAYKNTSLVIFGPAMQSNSGGLNQPTRTKLETTVEEHEFGHLLGLTNIGSAMVTPHEDAAHSGHCSNSSCLMYYSTNTTAIGGFILTSPIPQLDANCKADLTANGGR